MVVGAGDYGGGCDQVEIVAISQIGLDDPPTADQLAVSGTLISTTPVSAIAQVVCFGVQVCAPFDNAPLRSLPQPNVGVGNCVPWLPCASARRSASAPRR